MAKIREIMRLKLFGSLILLGAFTVALNAMEQESTTSAEEPIYETLARKKIKERAEAHAHWSENFKKAIGRPIDVVAAEAWYEEKYKELVEEYKEYEELLDQAKAHPKASLWGGINYAMTLDEMKQIVKKTFNVMKRDGLIISTDEFEKVKDQYFIDKPSTDLCRIWGIEYLKSKIKKKNLDSYAVPKYVIVADDPSTITVELSFFNAHFPIVNALKNAKIYFEFIKGKRVASWTSLAVMDLGADSGIGYDDFSDPGNIIKQETTGVCYIVDTEYKSFKIKLPGRLREVLEYAEKRFMYLEHENIGSNFFYEYTFELGAE